MAAFCGERGIAVSTFFARRRALALPTTSPTTSPTTVATPMADANAEAAFVEVVAGKIEGPSNPPRPRERAGSAPATSGSSGLELVLACGVKVNVSPGFDAALLRRVVEALS